MLQEILTYIIVFFAFGITIYKGLQSFRIIGRKKAMASSCSSCSSGACSNCSLNQITHEKPNFPVKVLHEEIK